MSASASGLYMVGGCAYRLQLSAAHASCIAALAALSSFRDDGPTFAGTSYRHTSNLPQGRALWMRDLIASADLRWAITLDSDTSVYPADLLMALCKWDELGEVAIGIVPVAEGGSGRVNLRTFDEIAGPRVVEASELGAIYAGNLPIESGGFGCAVFDLAWFRANWQLPEPEGHGIYTGEDLELCRSVRRRGGILRALAVRSVHAPFEG
jgi:hypothetical protein